MTVKIFGCSVVGCVAIHLAVKGYLDRGRDARERDLEARHFGEWMELSLDLERKKAEIQAKRDQANCEQWRKVMRAIESKG